MTPMLECFDFESDLLYAETKAISSYLNGSSFSVFEEIDPAVSGIVDYLKMIKLLICCKLWEEEELIAELVTSYCLSTTKAKKILDKIMKDERIVA